MKKVMMGVIVTLTLVQPMDAHQKDGKHCKSSEKRIEKIMDKLDDKLDLTDSQEDKIKTLFMEFASPQKESHKDRTADLQQLEQNIKALLNKDQLAKFDKMDLKKKMKKCECK